MVVVGSVNMDLFFEVAALPEPGARLAALQASREPLYREVADLVFDTSSLSPEAAADALAARLATREDLPA